MQAGKGCSEFSVDQVHVQDLDYFPLNLQPHIFHFQMQCFLSKKLGPYSENNHSSSG